MWVRFAVKCATVWWFKYWITIWFWLMLIFLWIWFKLFKTKPSKAIFSPLSEAKSPHGWIWCFGSCTNLTLYALYRGLPLENLAQRTSWKVYSLRVTAVIFLCTRTGWTHTRVVSSVNREPHWGARCTNLSTNRPTHLTRLSVSGRKIFT